VTSKDDDDTGGDVDDASMVSTRLMLGNTIYFIDGFSKKFPDFSRRGSSLTPPPPRCYSIVPAPHQLL
jgi:hypothetical protein